MNAEQRKRAGELNQRLVKLSTALIVSIRRMLKDGTFPVATKYFHCESPFPYSQSVFEWAVKSCNIELIIQLVDEGTANWYHRTELDITASRLAHAAIVFGLVDRLPEAREWLAFEREYSAAVNELGDNILWPSGPEEEDSEC